MTSLRRDQRGQATLEMIGIIPFFILIVGAILQIYMIGYAAVSAESAARMAAREYSQGADAASAEQAASNAAPDRFSPQVRVDNGNVSSSAEEPDVNTYSDADTVSAKATLTVPFLGIGVSNLNMHITRYVVLPKTN